MVRGCFSESASKRKVCKLGPTRKISHQGSRLTMTSTEVSFSLRMFLTNRLKRRSPVSPSGLTALSVHIQTLS